MDKTTEKGHSGVQVHSRGPIFPCVIARIETTRHGRYFPSGVLYLTTWELTAGDGSRMEFDTYDEAYQRGVQAAREYHERRAKREVKAGTYHADYKPTGKWMTAAEVTKTMSQMMDNMLTAQRKISDGAIAKMYDDMKQREVESMLEHFKYEDQKIGFKDRPHSETGGER